MALAEQSVEARESQARPSTRRRGVGFVLATGCWLLVYTVAVTYDLRSWMVVPSAWRYVRLPVDPAIAAGLDVPATATDVERLVERLVPWAADAAVYGVPWYFPTPSEALRAGRGDCEAQAVVLASLLASRGLPYRFHASFSHLWVDYPGRVAGAGELAAEAMMTNVGGRYRFRWPDLPELAEHWRAQVDLLWTPLHPTRKLLLVLGWPAILWVRLSCRRRGARRA